MSSSYYKTTQRENKLWCRNAPHKNSIELCRPKSKIAEMSDIMSDLNPKDHDDLIVEDIKRHKISWRSKVDVTWR